jgi:hypothetical protein
MIDRFQDVGGRRFSKKSAHILPSAEPNVRVRIPSYPPTFLKNTDSSPEEDSEFFDSEEDSEFFDAEDEKGTFVKTKTQYSLFWKNCTELLHQLFPGEFDCTRSVINTKFHLPLSCRWLNAKNSEKELENFKTAKKIITKAWSNTTTLACDLQNWAEQAIEPKEDRLIAVVAVVKRFSFLGNYSPFQHLTIFFYHEKRRERVCSIGINLRSSIDMINAGDMRISSPDKLLVKMYNPKEMDIVAVFPVEGERAFILNTAISHIQDKLNFHNISKNEFAEKWEKHKASLNIPSPPPPPLPPPAESFHSSRRLHDSSSSSSSNESVKSPIPHRLPWRDRFKLWAENSNKYHDEWGWAVPRKKDEDPGWH